jgi:hypothetical protein
VSWCYELGESQNEIEVGTDWASQLDEQYVLEDDEQYALEDRAVHDAPTEADGCPVSGLPVPRI